MSDYQDRHEFSVRANDPQAELIAHDALDPEEMAQVDAIMAASAALQQTERRIAAASQRYMALGRTDMHAIHFLLVQENLGLEVSPSSLAHHLGITTASTTKLLDRLVKAGHIERVPNPTDRRSWRIKVLPETRLAALRTVGQIQAARVGPLRRLSEGERGTVLRYLRQTRQALEQALEEILGPGA
ncbi:DNA-binding transcriptional regulator, MarR family [Propionibacterium cyclohexanicum]|uniref:DNA-binding transcriptional regulator, MarR family n=1 Tax=Propionibacterium cyclohexanicum TaxID=64702 RepID=A0A1H9TZP5_9ACTN|nr:MarR family transcriptional regulator [Propionibacterium cyclohexanicum]SES02431.1 DNA-binding transcriptional regulator, MarR family [Propionibacterium cyclohexanicum]